MIIAIKQYLLYYFNALLIFIIIVNMSYSITTNIDLVDFLL